MQTRKQAEDLIRLLCSSCGKRVKVSTKFAGQTGKCPKCGQPVQIPALEILEQKLKEIKGKGTNDSIVDVPDLPEQTNFPEETKDRMSVSSEEPPEPTAELVGLEEILQNPKMIIPEIPMDVDTQQTINKDKLGTSKRIAVQPQSNTTRKINQPPVQGNVTLRKVPSSAKSNTVGQVTKNALEQSTAAKKKESLTSTKSSPSVMKHEPAPFAKPVANSKAVVASSNSPELEILSEPAEAQEAQEVPDLQESSYLQEKWASPDPEKIFAEENHDWPEVLDAVEPLPVEVAEIQDAQLEESYNLQMNDQLERVSLEKEVPSENIQTDDVQVLEMEDPDLPTAVPVSAETLAETPSPISAIHPETVVSAETPISLPIAIRENQENPPNKVLGKDEEIVEIQELSSDSNEFSSEENDAEKELIEVEKLLSENKIKGGETLMLGKKALETTNFDEALQHLSSCINMGEDIGAAYYLRALAYIQRKAWGLAIDDLKNAIEFGYQDMDVEELHNRVILQQAITFRNMGAYRQALEILEQVISKNVNVEKGKIYWTRAKFLIQSGAQQNAMRDIEEAILNNYLKPEVFEARGRIYLEQGDYASAMHDFVAAINRGGKSASLYQARSEAYFFVHDLESALSDIQTAQSLSPDNPLLWDFEALILNEKKMYEASDEAFEKSFGLEPENPVHFFNRAMCYMRRNRYDRAIEDFTKVLEFNPKDRVAYLKRAICYQEKSNPNLALAREDFKKAENLEPNSMYRSTKMPAKKRKDVR